MQLTNSKAFCPYNKTCKNILLRRNYFPSKLFQLYWPKIPDEGPATQEGVAG
jgi:hypothetical protein